MLESISGSRAYGLETETSDTDIKGVFYLPTDQFYGLDYVAQVNNETNDIAYYELGRFVELLYASNPNILELLNSPQQAILYKHPLMDKFKPEWFLSKACIKTFVHYAQGQIKKAQGLNKKIINPVDKPLKTLLEFCYILEQGRTIPLNTWLKDKNWSQQYIGLSHIPNAQGLYGVYYDDKSEYQGIMKKSSATDVLLSRVPESAQLQAYLSFNKDGYSTYCKNYYAYWQWVNERNEVRYQQNVEHGRSYDSKNMMHTFRLLYMALDIAQTEQINVWRENREELLAIKQGLFSYEELLLRSEQLINQINVAFEKSKLPNEINKQAALNTLIDIRKCVYSIKD